MDHIVDDASLGSTHHVLLLEVLAHALIVDGEDVLLLLQLLAEEFDFPLGLGDVLPEGVVEKRRVLGIVI